MLIPDTLGLYGRTWTSEAVVRSILKYIPDEFLNFGQLNVDKPFLFSRHRNSYMLGKKKKKKKGIGEHLKSSEQTGQIWPVDMTQAERSLGLRRY